MKLNRFLPAVVFVASQLVIPRMANAAGEEITVQIKFRELCLTAQQTTTSKVSLANCRRDDSGQLFQIQKFPSTTKVQNGNFCLWAPKYGNGIDLQNSACKDSHLWSVDGKTLKLTGVSREYCLDIENGAASIGAVAQIWTCEYLGPGAAAQTFSLVELEFPVRVIGELPSTPSPGSTPSLDKPNREIIELPSTPSPGSTISPIDKALTNPWIPAPHRQSARCVDYLFVGFRGSGQQPDGFDSNYKRTNKSALINWSEPSFLGNVRSQRFKKTPAVDHLGRTLGGLYDAVRIHYKNIGKTVGFYSVGVSDAAALGPGSLYAATPTPTFKTIQTTATYIKAITLDTMNASRATSKVLENYRKLCSSAKILIAGYSQGAVLAKALAFSFNQIEVEGVMLVADPLFNREIDKDFLVGFGNDHETSGIFRNDISLLCDRNVLKYLCTRAGEVVPGFFALWAEMLSWRNSAGKDLSTKTARDLLKVSKRVAVMCNSGDLVCSPIRVKTRPPGIDSDIVSLITNKELIHERYGKVENPNAWWKEIVGRWLNGPSRGGGGGVGSW